MKDMRQSVAFEMVRSPEDWKRDYNLGHGISQIGYFRPPLASRSIGGLYFVGANTRPGTGVPLVTIGARLAAERIEREVAR
jgi:phytoene desaturase